MKSSVHTDVADMVARREIGYERVITLSFQKAILILVTAILGSAGAAVWGTLVIANTIPFRVDALERDVISIKHTVEDNNTKFMPLDLSTEKWKNNDAAHVQLEKQLDSIEAKVDEIRKAVK